MSTPLVSIHPANVQGIVARTYRHPFSRYLLFTFGPADGARAFLRALPPVASAEDWQQDRPGQRVNVGLSFPGLQACGALSADALGRFPLDFRMGPTPERMHDTPDRPWWNGVPTAELHALVV